MIQKVKLNNKIKYRFRVYYTDSYGKRKQFNSRYFDKKKDCQKAEAIFVGQRDERCTIRFYECAEDYLAKKKKVVKYRTYREQTLHINTYFNRWHDRKLSEIQPKEIELFFDELNYATGTKKKAFNTLNGIFKHGCLYFNLSSNPVDRVSRPKITEEERMKVLSEKKTIWTPEEFDKFESNIPIKHWQYKVFLHLLYWTGMRKNEALSLTWNDIDVERSTISIWRQYERETNEWKTLKTPNSQRKIHVDQTTNELLIQLKKYYSDKYDSFAKEWFAFGGLKPLSTTQIDRIKDRAEKAADLDHIRIHDFRHSHASYLIASGVNIVKVSRRLGHASISMTIDTYTHLLENSEEEIIATIEHVFKT